MFSIFPERNLRRHLVMEFNPHQVLAAAISRSNRDDTVLESMAEFAREDVDAIHDWVYAHPWTDVLCGLVPRRGIMQREALDPRRLGDPEYLANTIEEQQHGQFLSATPFKVVDPADWTLRAIDAAGGKHLLAEETVRPLPALICGIANDEIRDVQQWLLDRRLAPERIEAGLLSLFGAISRRADAAGELRAVAVVVVHEPAATVYILGREGVHTPVPILHGLGAIADIAKKELNLKNDAEAQRLLYVGDPAITQRADRLVRRLGRDLKPVLDSYEMTTGQPLDDIFCAYLPPSMSWLSNALAKATGRVPAVVDCAAWLPTVGLRLPEGAPPPGPHWIGALSLMAHLPRPTRLRKTDRRATSTIYHRPWHVDYKLPAIAAERSAAQRRFLTGVAAVALCLFAVAVTAWQVYANLSLRRDLDYWERQMTGNRQLFEELSAANVRLKNQSASLQQAFDLMAMPAQLSEFVLNLGRTIPAHMRIDRIEANDTRTAIGGVLLEPAEEATGTLGAYMESLRRNPAIGPLFANIAITSLQRKGEGDIVMFEITLRFKTLSP